MLCSKKRFRLFFQLCGITVILNVGLLFLVKDDHERHQIYRKREFQKPPEVSITKIAKIESQRFGCHINKYAQSAIQRAKSASCKQELANVACRIDEGTLYPKKLPRYCPLKADHGEGEYLGCYPKSRHFKYVIQLQIEDSTMEKCVGICLTQGYLFAGLQHAERKCWCGSILDQSARLEDHSCKTNCSEDHALGCNHTQEVVKVFGTGLPARQSKTASEVHTEDEVRDIKPVRIVFVFTVTGRAVRQIRRLLKAIYHVDHYYYFHVDSRQDYLYRELLKLESIFPNVRLARERLATIWGGASRLQAHFSIMKTLLRMGNWTWDYYLNLSESHYPLNNVTHLALNLRKYQGNNFIKSSKRTTPTLVTDHNFYECDEHLWLLAIGKRELPEGIGWDRGPDWLCLHRSFVEYAIFGSDPLLQGLKQLYKYTMSPVESFFHVLLHNSKFCGTWVNENHHVMLWLPVLSCQCNYHKDESDWCGCSPLVMKQKDFEPTLKHKGSRFVVWSRKFDPMIDQTVVNSIDRHLLGISYKDDPALHSYWQNDYHYLDKPRSSSDVIMTIAYSFIRRSVQIHSESTNACSFTNFKLLETHLLNVDDKFQGYLVKFQATRIRASPVHTLECNFSPIRNYKVFSNTGVIKRLARFQVGTRYDPKEDIFRNYPGFFGPRDRVISLRYIWKSGPEQNITVLWVDPSGKTALRRDTLIGFMRPGGVDTLESKEQFHPGIWQVLVKSKNETLAVLKFLVLPSMNAVNITGDHDQYFMNRHNATVVDDGVNDTKKVKHEDGIIDKTYGGRFLSWIDELTTNFWRLEGICSLHDITRDCPGISLCFRTSWSSFYPDPKSEIKLNSNGNVIK